MSVYPPYHVVTGDAELSDSPDGEANPLYRWRLRRRWAPKAEHDAWVAGGHRPTTRYLPWIMLNPSTADALKDDPTIRKCVGFARVLGYNGIAVWNLYAYRATKPAELRRAQRSGVDVVGYENDRRLRNLFTWAHEIDQPVIAAWGANAPDARVREILAMPRAHNVLHCLGKTGGGAPKHPVMLGYTQGVGDMGRFVQ